MADNVIPVDFGKYSSMPSVAQVQAASLTDYTEPPAQRRLDSADMNSPSREEIDAKLQAIEARMDARVASIEGKIDTMVVKLEHVDQLNAQTRSSVSSLKNTMLATAAASVLTILFGIAAFNATVLSNMLTSFESGKNTGAAIMQATEQLRFTQERLKSVEERLQAAPARK